LLWVWEHLDYATLPGNPTRVQTHVTISADGGATWAVPTRVFPVTTTETNFYFFPHGAVDQNDVAWVFAYFRTPTGNNRDLALRLYDGIWSATAPVVFNTADNIQWPAVLSTADAGAGLSYKRLKVSGLRTCVPGDASLMSRDIGHTRPRVGEVRRAPRRQSP